MHSSLLNITLHALTPDAASLIRQCLGASNLFEGNAWVIGVLEPVKPPLAARLELLREAVAL